MISICLFSLMTVLATSDHQIPNPQRTHGESVPNIISSLALVTLDGDFRIFLRVVQALFHRLCRKRRLMCNHWTMYDWPWVIIVRHVVCGSFHFLPPPLNLRSFPCSRCVMNESNRLFTDICTYPTLAQIGTICFAKPREKNIFLQ